MTDIDTISQEAQQALAAKHMARERALPKSRACIRLCANTIRATHRNDFTTAHTLLLQAKALIMEMHEDLHDFPDIYFAGFVEDAQKEFAEASATLAVIQQVPLPTPKDLTIEWAAYLNGLGETIGELRRHTLDHLRQGHFADCERLLGVMDDIFAILTSLDYPDAITNGLRRTTDVARGIIEKTRGDLTSAAIQVNLSEHITRLSGEIAQWSQLIPLSTRSDIKE